MKYRYLLVVILILKVLCANSVAYDVLFTGVMPMPPPELRFENNKQYLAITGFLGSIYGLRPDGTIEVIYGERTKAISDLSDVSAISVSWDNGVALKTDGTLHNLGRDDVLLKIPSGLKDIVAIDTSRYFSMALTSSGSVVVWGSDEHGILDVPSGLSDVIAIAAGGGFALALRSDGTVVSWGESDFGLVEVPDSLNNVVAIDAGYNHAVALRNDGTVVAWGNNTFGQLNIPNGLDNVVKISTSYAHTLALKNDGTVVGWGLNDYGIADAPNDLSDVISIFAGDMYSVAIKSDSSIVPWGLNTIVSYFHTYNLRGIKKIIVHSGYALALRNDGSVTAWGGPNDISQSPIASKLSGIVDIATNDYVSIGINSDGSTIAWDPYFYEPVDNIPTFQNVASISLGGSQVLVLRNDKTLEIRNLPTVSDGPFVPTTLSNITAISSGGSHSVALNESSTALIWWRTPDMNETRYKEIENVKAVSAANFHTLCIMNDGSVQVIPSHPFDQEHVLVRTFPQNLFDVQSVATGIDHAVALKYDGSVIAWGDHYQTDVPSNLNGLLAISASDICTFYYFPDGALSGCIVNETILTAPYFPSIGEGFAYGMNSQSYFYTALCPFVYDFGTSGWWYLYEGNINPNAFWIYSYNDASWKFVLSGYVLDL